MGLTYHYKFTAPGNVAAEELETFLKKIETDVKKMGFDPTLVLNARFDTPERRTFARRLTSGFPIEDERLKGVTLLDERSVWSYSPTTGTCRVIPEKAVVLVVTDDRRCETCFGFLRYPAEVKDINGKVLAETGLGDRWTFQEFIKTPDRRFRQIVKLFTEAGYVEVEEDDYAAK